MGISRIGGVICATLLITATLAGGAPSDIKDFMAAALKKAVASADDSSTAAASGAPAPANEAMDDQASLNQSQASGEPGEGAQTNDTEIDNILKNIFNSTKITENVDNKTSSDAALPNEAPANDTSAIQAPVKQTPAEAAIYSIIQANQAPTTQTAPDQTAISQPEPNQTLDNQISVNQTIADQTIADQTIANQITTNQTTADIGQADASQTLDNITSPAEALANEIPDNKTIINETLASATPAVEAAQNDTQITEEQTNDTQSYETAPASLPDETPINEASPDTAPAAEVTSTDSSTAAQSHESHSDSGGIMAWYVEPDLMPYTNDDSGLSIGYPNGWSAEERTVMGLKADAFLAPNEADSGAFRNNVNIIIQDLPGQMTLDEYVDQSASQITKLMAGSSIVSLKDTTLGGEPAKELIYTASQGGYDLELMQVYAIRDSSAYILTYTAEKERFSSDLLEVKRMVNSFEFI